MPIDYSNYDQAWKSEIRPRILARAKHCCEECGVRNYSVGVRASDGRFIPTAGNIVHDLAGQGLSHPSMEPMTYKEARAIADHCTECEGIKYLVIVLTIAHLDHDISNNVDENLKALCQYHHLKNDQEQHKRTRLKNKGVEQITMNL